ncbi:MAG: tRNA (adenosine(37)-N6)-threonylcarbamoyltransferase complex ATPase subunit type 1 TsaE [Clostridia bacterium]|nr:tRNA (adenosine(37)-N6)-threonylcarbamoyltransferase complex ATPase subunit type 1 TsaE [Clostridia bacterium]
MIYNSSSQQQTIKFAQQFARQLKGGDVVVLRGQLGAGKTHFAKGVALALGITDTVTSPTFAIHNIYYGRLTLHHFDFYRLTEREGEYLGFEEFIGDSSSITLIEWADNVPSLIPGRHITVDITITGDTSRHITVNYV